MSVCYVPGSVRSTLCALLNESNFWEGDRGADTWECLSVVVTVEPKSYSERMRVVHSEGVELLYCPTVPL